ncbi:hypothetical protein [Massilibacteroides sp.]|uniref:DUF6922 domain-containing protein n=1 Tax=Massilibacteroides sp. TaxID=2034766 RepID=UPI00261B4AB6|nr:hypothetical protein [Massilibacteroides sp.]MDD4515982.1 hypothetical protein [Massilibacteroides sp.]
MFFTNYPLHKDARIRPSLLWEYDPDDFDWQAMRQVVVQRVIERGRMDDFYAALNLYGIDGFKEAIKNIPDMNRKDIAFVCTIFDINKEELKCYSKKQSPTVHWRS